MNNIEILLRFICLWYIHVRKSAYKKLYLVAIIKNIHIFLHFKYLIIKQLKKTLKKI